jgi:hypothetical protein
MSGWWMHELWERSPVLLASWVFWVLVSVMLHELAHGWTALWQGDDTPRAAGHMNFNPLVHMGPTSLIFFAAVGFAWGQMPVSPFRFRMGRMGEEGLPPLHPLRQGRRPMRQPPDDPHQGQGQNQKADRLVELEHAVGCGLAPRLFDRGGHPPPHRDHGQDAERDHPVQGDGDGGIAGGGHRALRIRTQAAPAASAIAVRGSKTALYPRSGRFRNSHCIV